MAATLGSGRQTRACAVGAASGLGTCAAGVGDAGVLVGVGDAEAVPAAGAVAVAVGLPVVVEPDFAVALAVALAVVVPLDVAVGEAVVPPAAPPVAVGLGEAVLVPLADGVGSTMVRTAVADTETADPRGEASVVGVASVALTVLGMDVSTRVPTKTAKHSSARCRSRERWTSVGRFRHRDCAWTRNVAP